MSDDEASNDGINEQEEADLTAGMTLYFLMQSISKLPIKRVDIIAHCLRGNKRQFEPIFETTLEQLKEIYGMDVVRVEGIKTGQQYLCVSKTASPSLLGRNCAQTKTLPVLFLVLVYIFMKGGILSEQAILSFLEKVGIECEDSVSTEFGNVKKLVSETFVKQMYLTKTKTITEPNNDVRINFEWGQRAKLEFQRSAFLEVVADMLQKPVIAFKRQFEEAAAAAADELTTTLNRNIYF